MKSILLLLLAAGPAAAQTGLAPTLNCVYLQPDNTVSAFFGYANVNPDSNGTIRTPGSYWATRACRACRNGRGAGSSRTDGSRRAPGASRRRIAGISSHHGAQRRCQRHCLLCCGPDADEWGRRMCSAWCSRTHPIQFSRGIELGRIVLPRQRDGRSLVYLALGASSL
jgi:hypothetical protein